MSMKRMVIMLLISGVVFGGVFGFVAFRNQMIKEFFASRPVPVVPVAAEPAQAQEWDVVVPAIGTLRAINGVDVSSSVPGLVQQIAFESGVMVAKGEPLMRLDADVEIAELRSAEARLELARTIVQRARTLARSNNVSEAVLEKAESELKVADAEVASLKAQIEKKSIRAPFGGRLGVRKIDVGQYLQAGTPIVTLQDLSVMLVDFSVSQKDLPLIRVGQPVRLTTDVWPDRVFEGTVSAVEPLVDEKTGMIGAEASLPNADGALRAGMFAKLEVVQPRTRRLVTIPATAVSYNLYGDSVFVVADNAQGQSAVTRALVELGERRGGRVVVTKGIEAGQVVVTSGQLKLENGSLVRIEPESPLREPRQFTLQ